MKKLVPFKKDIKFKTNIYEITSISLEHTLKRKDNTITGELIISGDYKINSSSTNTDNFKFNLPFDIQVGDNYILDEVVVDIDDFYYEVQNENTLKVVISISLDKLKEKELPVIEEKEIERSNEIIEKIEEMDDKNMENIKEERCIEEEDIGSLFEIKEKDEKFSTYKVYIVREGDTIESIMSKYSVNRELLDNYNDLSEIKIGDKIIIPSV